MSAHRPGPWYFVTKRAFDIVVSGTMLLLASPVLAIAAIATKLSSPGPVF